jgi:hypothetical protein
LVALPPTKENFRMHSTLSENDLVIIRRNLFVRYRLFISGKGTPAIAGPGKIDPLQHRLQRSRASERGLGGKGRTVFPEILQTLAQQKQGLGHAPVFLARFLDLALSDEVLELLVSAQPQHFLTATSGFPSPKSRINDAEKGLEFVRFRVRQSCHELLSNIVRTSTGEGAEI